jgi:hypothetical protein
MLDEYNTPEKLWTEVINTTCYASNRLFLQKFLGKTPYELLNGKKPDVSFFQVFNHATGLVEETHDVEFDESNGS